MAPVAQLAKDRLSDAGGLGFESQTAWATGKSIPSLLRDMSTLRETPEVSIESLDES